MVMAVKLSACKTFSRIHPDTICPSIHSFIDFIMYWAFPIVMVNILSVSVSRVYERQLCVQVCKIKWIISSSKLLPYICLHLTTQRQTSEIFAACLSHFCLCQVILYKSAKTIFSLPKVVLVNLHMGCWHSFPLSLQAAEALPQPQRARIEGMDVSTGRTSSRKVLDCRISTRPVCDWTWEKGEAEMLTFWIWQLDGGQFCQTPRGDRKQLREGWRPVSLFRHGRSQAFGSHTVSLSWLLDIKGMWLCRKVRYFKM